MGRGGYVEFYRGNSSLAEVMGRLESLTASEYFHSDMVFAAIEMMFYNKNSNLGIFMTLKYFSSNSGQRHITKETKLYLPQNYAQ